jgi:hypothetical protein
MDPEDFGYDTWEDYEDSQDEDSIDVRAWEGYYPD